MASIYDSLIGLRLDGRKPNELRKISCEVGVFPQADGSALLTQGNTKVLATIYGPHEVKLLLLYINLCLK
jgi:ribonuclease PH